MILNSELYEVQATLFYYSVIHCSLFFTILGLKGLIKILEYSDVFKREYDSEEVRYIPNMMQNYKYLSSPLSNGQLVDVICGNENRIVFVWKKSKEMNELYRLWCEHKLD